MADQVRDSPSYYDSTTTTTTGLRRRGLSKSQMCLHKILRIIASYSPPPSDSSNQGSSCSNREAEKAEKSSDLCSGKRGIEIDLNEAAAAVGSVGSGSCLDCEATAVVEKSSEGECDPISNKDCSAAADEDSRRFEDEDLEIEARESCRVVEIGSDRRLSILIEAAELAASVSDDFETGKIEEEEEEDSGSQSPSLRFGGGEETKRRRKRNKCWLVDLYRETERSCTAEAAERKRRKRGGRRQVVVSPRNRDSSAVLDPARRSSPRLAGGGGGVAETLSTAAVVGRKRKSR
ncbi:hypothetical protein LINGRAHAP2_LOCUS29820 [Linum grandiflorum]